MIEPRPTLKLKLLRFVLFVGNDPRFVAIRCTISWGTANLTLVTAESNAQVPVWGLRSWGTAHVLNDASTHRLKFASLG